MTGVDSVGLTAGLCTTASFIPQIVRILRTKSAEDVSLVMILILLAGTVLWLGYGIMIAALPIIISNGVTFLLVSLLLLCKIKYRGPDPDHFCSSRPEIEP